MPVPPMMATVNVVAVCDRPHGVDLAAFQGKRGVGQLLMPWDGLQGNGLHACLGAGGGPDGEEDRFNVTGAAVAGTVVGGGDEKARKCRTCTPSCAAGADGDANAAPAAPSVASPVKTAAPIAAARREICMMTHLLGFCNGRPPPVRGRACGRRAGALVHAGGEGHAV